MKIRMKIVSGYPHGACSYYRSNGVFPKLDIHTDMMEDVNWPSLVNFDIVLMERPSDINYYNAAHLVKDYGLKLWVDFDDNFFCLPDWNGAKAHYDDPTNQGAMIRCLKLADVVTVTTQAIKDEYCKYNDNIQVIPNAFNDYNYSFDKKLSDNKTIFWRGSTTHKGDLYQFGSMDKESRDKIAIINKPLYNKVEIDEFIEKIINDIDDIFVSGYVKNIWEVADKYKDWKWQFVGNDIDFMTRNVKNKKVLPEQHIVQYFATIKKMNPAIYIVPLAFHEFNECKSNCGWIEATYAGAATLAPDMPEWRKPGIINYKTKAEFQAGLERLIDSPELRAKSFEQSYNYIKDNLMLSKVNKKRYHLLREVMNK